MELRYYSRSEWSSPRARERQPRLWHRLPRIARLLGAWRSTGRPIRHVVHDSVEPNSLLRPDSPGNAIQAIATPNAGEPVYRKHVNSAFIGTKLEDGIDTVVVVGLTTNHRVSTRPDCGESGFQDLRGFRCDCELCRPGVGRYAAPGKGRAFCGS